MSEIMWHDVECGGYAEDLPLWRELAAAEAGPVLDVGAGAGRVALELARAGHDVTALDLDAELLAELRARAQREGLQVRTEQADAAGFELSGPPFGLIAVPMQTIQLLPGARPAPPSSPPPATTSRAAAWWRSRSPRSSSRSRPTRRSGAARTPASATAGATARFPVAIRERGDRVVLERVRVLTAPDGTSVERGRRDRAGHADRPRPRGRGPRRRARARAARASSRRPTPTSARWW